MKFEFVETIPEIIKEKVVYITFHYNTAIHKCMCGCGNEVVTPLSPDDWELTYDGESISLYPSIGNWSFKCQSHYWIRNSEVIWSEKWSRSRIDMNRKIDKIKRNHNNKTYNKGASKKGASIWKKIISILNF